MFKNETKQLAGVGTLVGCALVMVLYVCGFCVMVHDFVQAAPARVESVETAQRVCGASTEC